MAAELLQMVVGRFRHVACLLSHHAARRSSSRLRRMEIGDELVERPRRDRLAQSQHQIAIILQIVPGQQHARRGSPCAAQMVEIGAAVAGAGGAARIRDRAARGSSAWRALRRLTRAAPGEGLGGAAGARRQDAIEHVDAALHRADDVLRLADAHEIARPVAGQRRHGLVEHAEHRLLPLADRKAADGIAVEADVLRARAAEDCRRSG